jgi:prepilin-type N-terminal cleavage/methylation domain-containing protein
MADNPSHSESGFTLVETLVALLILAISSGLLVQSIALASSQITSARHVLAAEQTALSVLAEHSGSANISDSKEGVDNSSNLFWRFSVQTVARRDDNSELSSIETIEIEVSLRQGSPTIYRLKTLIAKRQTP